MSLALSRFMATWIRWLRARAMLLAVASSAWSVTARADDTHPSRPQAPEATPVMRDDGDGAIPSSTQPATGSTAAVPPRDASAGVPALPEVPDEFAIRRLTFEAHVGVATPVG